MVPREARPLLAAESDPELPDPYWARQWEMTEVDHPVTAPQCIAHRGYKAKYPENSMAAFRGAVAAGAHAIESDLHLTKDGVVVLSHDGTLKRCFGVDKKIDDCDWEYISSLRTLRAPHEPMPKLSELLAFLTEDGQENVWLLLDVKLDDDCEELMRRTADTIRLPPTQPDPGMDGCAGTYCLSLSLTSSLVSSRSFANAFRSYIAKPGLPPSTLAHRLLLPRLLPAHLSFNILQIVLAGPLGPRFLLSARSSRRPVFAWTVNRERWMEWAVRARVDGLITDDPALYLDVCARWLREESSRCRAESESASASSSGSPPAPAAAAVRKTARFGKRRGLVSDALSLVGLLCMNLLAAALAVLFTVTGRYDQVTTKPRAKTR
ncbi:hypothetical protein jhhlp_006423 [Lomentospora prolificans]|uniref:GP-PDE domain-containing protein n=1 Tax=Lomentospora prolificans TaxID=41688 RepID=A0A2N3N5W0_9PEZI|nr:hypothetical protein jhhlp_006423 [Lomentospora prolificans]